MPPHETGVEGILEYSSCNQSPYYPPPRVKHQSIKIPEDVDEHGGNVSRSAIDRFRRSGVVAQMLCMCTSNRTWTMATSGRRLQIIRKLLEPIACFASTQLDHSCVASEAWELSRTRASITGRFKPNHLSKKGIESSSYQGHGMSYLSADCGVWTRERWGRPLVVPQPKNKEMIDKK